MTAATILELISGVVYLGTNLYLCYKEPVVFLAGLAASSIFQLARKSEEEDR